MGLSFSLSLLIILKETKELSGFQYYMLFFFPPNI